MAPAVSGRERMRKYRARLAQGKCLITIEVDETLAEELVEVGLLAAWDSEKPGALKAAIEKLLITFRARDA